MARMRHMVLLPSTSFTTTAAQSGVISIEGYTSCIIALACSTVTGTTPTCDVYIQQGIYAHNTATVVGQDPGDPALTQPPTINYDDFAAFAQLTTSNTTRYLRIVGGGNVESAASATALSAATVRNGPLGSFWRVNVKIGGTSPNFANVKVVAQLIA